MNHEIRQECSRGERKQAISQHFGTEIGAKSAFPITCEALTRLTAVKCERIDKT